VSQTWCGPERRLSQCQAFTARCANYWALLEPRTNSSSRSHAAFDDHGPQTLKFPHCTILVGFMMPSVYEWSSPHRHLMYTHVIPTHPASTSLMLWKCYTAVPKRGVPDQSENLTAKNCWDTRHSDCMRRWPPDYSRKCRTQETKKQSGGSPQSTPHLSHCPNNLSACKARSWWRSKVGTTGGVARKILVDLMCVRRALASCMSTALGERDGPCHLDMLHRPES